MSVVEDLMRKELKASAATATLVVLKYRELYREQLRKLIDELQYARDHRQNRSVFLEVFPKAFRTRNRVHLLDLVSLANLVGAAKVIRGL